MTIKRILKCNNADCPHEIEKKFNDWVRDNLPEASTGFMVTDIDFIFYNYNTKKIMFIEVKTHNKQVKDWQRNLFHNISEWVKNGIDNTWDYLGFHLLTFENTCFDDGLSYYDNKPITERQFSSMIYSLFGVDYE